jgi:hypothetical protein
MISEQLKTAYQRFRGRTGCVGQDAAAALERAKAYVWLQEQVAAGRLRVRWVPDHEDDEFWGCMIEVRTGLNEWEPGESLWAVDVCPPDPYCTDVEADLAFEVRRQHTKYKTYGTIDEYKGNPDHAPGSSKVPTNWISCEYLEVGDYAGSGDVGESNIRALARDLGEGNWFEEDGDYYFRKLWVLDTFANRETLRELVDDNPIYDESENCEVRIEWEETAFWNWVADDISRELEEVYGEIWRTTWNNLPMGFKDVDDEAEQIDGKYNPGLPNRCSIYRNAMGLENEEPIFEYSSCTVPIERIVDAVAYQLLPLLTQSAEGVKELEIWWEGGEPAVTGNPVPLPATWTDLNGLAAFADELVAAGDTGLGPWLTDALAALDRLKGWNR